MPVPGSYRGKSLAPLKSMARTSCQLFCGLILPHMLMVHSSTHASSSIDVNRAACVHEGGRKEFFMCLKKNTGLFSVVQNYISWSCMRQSILWG